MYFRILIISGDDSWRDRISRATSGMPYHLNPVSSASQGWEAVEREATDLIIIDLELPSLERLGWFKLLRQTASGRGLPAMLASRNRDEDEVAEAFENEADDFVLKDCEPAELAARVKAVLRRNSARDWRVEGPLKIGAVTLDPARHLCLVGRRPVELNAREFELAEILMRKAGRVLSRSYLLETVWGMSREAQTRAVDVAVSRLRKALGKRAGRWIETVDRYGYRFREPGRFSR